MLGSGRINALQLSLRAALLRLAGGGPMGLAHRPAGPRRLHMGLLPQIEGLAADRRSVRLRRGLGDLNCLMCAC
jgi:hypothetical protein